MRKCKIERETLETKISILLNLDGDGKYKINTSLRFLDHLLETFAKYGNFNIEITSKGDIDVDDHHLVEDIGIVLGRAFKKCTGGKKGIKRISSAIVPMDDSLAMVAVDISGRAFFKIKGSFKREKIGDVSTENIPHFLDSFAKNYGITLHCEVEGVNDHHKAEALFKALGIAISDALTLEDNKIKSTKGLLD